MAESRAAGSGRVGGGAGTELFFILWRAQDAAWHWTQARQAARGPLHIPEYARALKRLCVAMCVGAPGCSPTN